MTESLVSLEVAKLLKDKGFNEYCEWAIDDKGEMYDLDEFAELSRLNTLHPAGFYSMPTQTLAQKWLRDTQRVIVLVDYDSTDTEYWCNITYMDSSRKEAFTTGLSCDTYESALEEGLKQALKLI